MAKKFGIIDYSFMIAGIVALAAIGFAMADGPLSNAISFLPLIVHQIVGWTLVGIAGLGVFDLIRRAFF